MEKFDGFHMYFLDTDREDFEIRLGLNMPTYLSDGNLYPAYKIFERFQKRSYDRIDWVFERLEKPFELSSDKTYRPDRKEAEWPKDKAAADKLWEARLTYEILNEVLSEETSDKGDGEKALIRSNLLAVDPQRKYSKRQLKPSVVDSRDGKKL